MANVIKLKRGTSTPTTSDIVDGEVAIDKSAQKFYVNDGGTVKEIGGGGGLTSDAQENTVGGSNAGDSFSGTDATDNTLIGFKAGTAINTGDNNTGYGHNSLISLTTGSNNTAVGRNSLRSATSVSGSEAFGNQALFSAVGGNNVAIGTSAMFMSTNADKNLACGSYAAGDITSGTKNTILGYQAGNSGTNDLTTGSNNILIGHNATASSATVSNEITLGDANITKLRIPALSFSISASAVTNGAAFYENAKTVAADYTLSGSNAMAAGPITINSNVTVTVSSGDTLTIV